MNEEEEEFLYGENENLNNNNNNKIVEYNNNKSEVVVVEGESVIAVENELEEESEESEEEDSEDDLEIILDGDLTTAPIQQQQQQYRRLPIPQREVIPVRVVVEPVTQASNDLLTKNEAGEEEKKEGIELIESNDEGIVTPAIALVPHGSLTPFLAPLPPSETNPTLDVNFIAKDANGNDLFDFDIDSLEDKPWRRPGANMADYFNYGMNEPAWKNYATKQKRIRHEQVLANNPFAAFAEQNITEAWQSLAPEFKAIMMATVMGYQPGMSAPPPQSQPQMMNMMGMNQAYANTNFGGMNNMNMNMYGGGINNNFNVARTNFVPGFTGRDAALIPTASQFIGEDAFVTGDGYIDSTIPSNEVGSDEVSPGFSVVDPNHSGSIGSTSLNRGGAQAIKLPLGPSQRGLNKGGMEGATIPTAPRNISQLPANVPTGPRNPGISVQPRRTGYQDKDRSVTASEGLDYGGSSRDQSTSRAKGTKEVSPEVSRKNGQGRTHSDSGSGEIEKSSHRRDRDSKGRDDVKEEEMQRSYSSSSSSRRKRGVDDFFPDKSTKYQDESESSNSTVGTKARGISTKSELLEYEPETLSEASHRNRRNESETESNRRKLQRVREEEDLRDAEDQAQRRRSRKVEENEEEVESQETNNRRRNEKADNEEEIDANSRRSKRSSREEVRRSYRNEDDKVYGQSEEQEGGGKDRSPEREDSRLKRRKVDGYEGDGLRKSRNGR